MMHYFGEEKDPMRPATAPTRDRIERMLWEDWDGFFQALHEIANGETKREVISTELKEWWEEMDSLLARCPVLPPDE